MTFPHSYSRIAFQIALFGLTLNSYAQEGQTGFVQAGISSQNFHYKETDAQGAMLDREDGLLPGVEIAARIRNGRYTSLITASLHGGTITYDGQTQGGSSLTTDTQERIADVAVSIMRTIDPSSTSPRLSAGFGYREWRRDIQPTNFTSGLYETYRWPYWMLGVNADFLQNGHWKAGLDWRLMRPIYPTIEIEADGFDPLTLDLGARLSVYVGFPVEYRFRSKQSIVIRPYWQTWFLERSNSKRLYSNGNPTGLIATEPDSETVILGITASLRFTP